MTQRKSGVQRILLVDDDRSVRWTIATFLEAEGYTVQTAADGAAALAVIEQNPPDLVLLDMDMPVMSGGEFVGELRARNTPVPVIAMTAARDARRWAEQIGASGYVVKPISFPALIGRIDEVSASG